MSAPRGRLRVYLGAAPGVGKTYAMLREGHRLRAEGEDVVVGLIEAHGRRDTAGQIGDLEVIPRRLTVHGTVVLSELDVEAVIERRPDLALIDELAHTNAPGSERVKRWQDIEVILDAGIDVITTVNIQHLEQVHGLVASITGVDVRETVPDRVLDEASEVQLVDLPAGALLNRLEAGRIYPQEQADAALVSFFREGNLTALRELALRYTAEGVDERLADLMATHGDGLVAASDRWLVLVDDDRRWGSVVRSAWRMVSALHGDLLAIALAPQGDTSALIGQKRHRIEANLELAEDLGAERLVEDDGSGSIDDVADALARVIRRERVSVLVVASAEGARQGIFRRSRPFGHQVATAVMTRVAGVEVHLASYRSATEVPPEDLA